MKKKLKKGTTKLFKEFFESEKSGGLLLIACTLVSLVLANSGLSQSYTHFWHCTLANQPLEYWINDGLMTFFFLLIGLELERELYQGELSDIKKALLPIFGAFGGMIFPAFIYLVFNFGTTTQAGAGIPMATDIAFALGILSLLGNRVPTSLKIFLTALAVIDDLGAILVIALFYTKTIFWNNLAIALGIFVVLLFMNRLKIRNLIPYLIGGFAMWFFMLHSGVHATITGVLLAFAIPFGNGNNQSSSYILQDYLHKPVAYFVLPLFALANTAIYLPDNFQEVARQSYSIGVFIGLVFGKPLGIFAICFLAVKLKFCKLPNDLNFQKIAAVGFLGGIGFTMSIFVTLLAFEDLEVINNAKFMVLMASLTSGIVGFFCLRKVLK